MTSKPLYYRVVAAFLIPFLANYLVIAGLVNAFMASPSVYADDFQDSANDGGSFGDTLLSNQESTSDSDGNVTANYSYTDSEGNVHNESEAITREEMIQGSSGSWSSYSDAYGDESKIQDQANANKSQAEGGDSQMHSEGFMSLSKGSQRSHPDLSSDPMWANTKASFDSVENQNKTCPPANGTNITINECQRNNTVARCDVVREVYTTTISTTIKVMEYQGCFDHANMKFTTKIDTDAKAELKGYFIDRATYQRHDYNANYRFMTVPADLFSYPPNGANSREYYYLPRKYNNDYQGLYGVFREDIQSVLPEINYTLSSTRGHGDDIVGGAYHYFNPIDASDFSEEENAQLQVDNISWNITSSMDMAVSSAKIRITQAPTEDNNWEIIINLDDNGSSGGTPACPIYSTVTGSISSSPGYSGVGTAYGRVTLTASVEGKVITERVVEGPKSCRSNISSQCSSTFTCTDDTPRTYDGVSDAAVRAELSPLFPGDNPQDTTKNICYAASISSSCASETNTYDASQSCQQYQSDPTCSFEGTKECGQYDSNGRCEYYIDTYSCGHNTEASDQCALREELVDMFPGCEEQTTQSSTVESTFLPDEKQCEKIFELNSCRVQRTVGSDVNGNPTYTETQKPSEGGNSPCLKADDGFTKPTWQCNQRIPAYKDANGNNAPSPFTPIYPGDDGYCTDATATYDTYFWRQPANCYVDIYGDTQCPQANENNVDKNTCDDLAAQGCYSKNTKRCVEDSTSPENGFCYLEESDYECGETVERQVITADSEYSCGASPIRCMGNDCFPSKKDPGASEDFAQAAAAMQLQEYMANDGKCDANGNCEIFAAEEYYCKKALGGVQDCCENPGGPGIGEYVSLIIQAQKGAAAVANIEAVQVAGEAVAGAWNAMKEPVVALWDDMASKFFTSAVESATAESGASAAGSTLTSQMATWVGDVFGDAVRDAIFTTTAEGTTMGGGTAYVGTAMNFLATAFMYYAIAMLVIQVVWKCEEEEFEYASKRTLRVCHKVGSYCAQSSGIGNVCVEKREVGCCFSSPLPRIINEQARIQLGISWGTPESPNCQGLSMDQLALIDWSQVDLSEWIALLNQSGNMPSSDVEDRFSIEEVTGDGNALNNKGTDGRQNTLDRSKDRWDGVDEDQLYNNVENDLWGQE